MSYRHLDLEKTRETLRLLRARIDERFPGSGLSQVARELGDVAMETEAKVVWISTPNYLMRAAAGVLIAGILGVLGLSVLTVDWTIGNFPLTEFIQVTEAAFNDLVLIGAAIFFLVSVETRVKRARILASLNELRAIAHVIDMHQLTKDPTDRVVGRQETPSSPRRDLSSFELSRYLDYCSELLSLVSKLASIYAQHFPEGTVVSAVNELENLTTGLSRKIWQKIVILQGSNPKLELVAAPAAAPARARAGGKPRRKPAGAASKTGRPRKAE
jgi:hypothetical protein